MLKKHQCLVLALAGLVSCSNDDTPSYTMNSNSEPMLTTTLAFGGSGDDTARSVIETSDGGFAVLGFTNSINGHLATKTLEVNDYWVLKFNSQNELEWQKTYGGSGDDRGQAIIQTSDGGYAITGYAQSDDGDASNNEGFHDNWILKLDATGNILWQKSFGYAGHDHSYDLVETADNGLFFSGFLDVTSSNGEGATDKNSSLFAHGVGEFWGTKIDNEGVLQWRKYFGGTNNDRAYGVVKADDGGYVMAGFTESDDFDISSSKGSYDFWVVKVNKLGDLEWEQSFGGTGIDQAQDIANTTDGGYAIVGHTFSTDIQVTENYGESDIWLVKINRMGRLDWQRNFGGSEFDAAHSVKPTLDGGFLLAGNSKSSDADLTANNGENDMWLLKTNETGELLWQISIGGSDLDFAYDAIETSTGDIIVVGESASADFPNHTLKDAQDLIILRFSVQ